MSMFRFFFVCLFSFFFLNAGNIGQPALLTAGRYVDGQLHWSDDDDGGRDFPDWVRVEGVNETDRGFVFLECDMIYASKTRSIRTALGFLLLLSFI